MKIACTLGFHQWDAAPAQDAGGLGTLGMAALDSLTWFSFVMTAHGEIPTRRKCGGVELCDEPRPLQGAGVCMSR